MKLKDTALTPGPVPPGREREDAARALQRVADGRKRAVVESVTPMVDHGRFMAKRCAGDTVTVEADVFVDGHDVPRALLLHRKQGGKRWNEAPMSLLANDRWRGELPVPEIGVYEYTIAAWADAFASWRRDLARWSEAEDVAVSLAVGAMIVGAAAERARGADAKRLEEASQRLAGGASLEDRRAAANDPSLEALVAAYPDRATITTFEPVLALRVDPPLARFSSWYEMFPRSAAGGGRHGTFRDVEARLDYVEALGFDVLYFPPIHPIGRTQRKGPNNAVVSGSGDPGSPWAIGSAEGGHKAIHPELGTPEDFRRLVRAARERGIELALDIAFQASPDHPYVKAHPDWFRHRPDGSIQYAENPPKKYQDIYPFDFESESWSALWHELRDVFLHWIAQGVRVFRVDNPHTKPFAFWEWAIAEVKREHPDVIFLSEAFTRPKVMHRLAKLGFSQSYTYYAWRNAKGELVDYFTELSRHASREYFRPNVWPNTPDILTAALQTGGRAAFMSRFVLAATLSANYGIYGPAFELQEHVPLENGSEEYRDSEKYQIRDWHLERPDSLKGLIATLNRIRRDNPALQQDWRLAFHPVDNDQILCYSKTTADLSNVMLVAVNLDPRNVQSGWVDLALGELGIDTPPFEVHDLLTDARYTWNGPRNYLELRPHDVPAHVFRVVPGSNV
ncbi:MAG TPA: alpha-1,4-glucan--maltose-1-phosphate maltosyltransferase [Burkholderiales bacterium]|nr:alpha-1,4-glucan--maltose-1-phosphate maltosyltransferase [Burkholderiales bacterium]